MSTLLGRLAPAFVLLGLVAAAPALADEYDPSGFHDCVLERTGPGMEGPAIAVVRQSCAYRFNTDTYGKRTSFPEVHIAEDALLRELEDLPEFSLMNNAAIVQHVQENYYPDESYEQVKEWLTRSQSEHGQPPKPRR